LGQLERSLVNYGIPDFTGANMSQASEREQLRSTVQRVIERFEPRFKSVRVTMIDPENEADRVLRFRIDAMLYAEPAPEPVVFDSKLEPASASFEVSRAG
jgi:type VI secretion system protein ImpF